jgi:anti-sigma factor RsiW
MSLALDGELSELGQARLDAHLERCPDCRAFGTGSTTMTALLRQAPREEMSVPILMPRPRRLSAARILQASAAAAAVALVAGLSAIHGIGQRSSSPPEPNFKLSPAAALGHDDELALIRPVTPRIDYRTAL